MFAKVPGRVGVALLGAVIAVVLNCTLLACSGTTATGAATVAATVAGVTPTGAATGPADSPATARPVTLNVEVVHVSRVLQPHEVADTTVSCPEGTAVTSGGFKTSWASVIGSWPNGTTQWVVTARNEGDSTPVEIVAWAICTSLSQ